MAYYGMRVCVCVCFWSLQEFHRYAHMMDPPPLAKDLQSWGVLVSRKEHGLHHSSPFEEKYCIVSGACNGPLDYFRV